MQSRRPNQFSPSTSLHREEGVVVCRCVARSRLPLHRGRSSQDGVCIHWPQISWLLANTGVTRRHTFSTLIVSPAPRLLIALDGKQLNSVWWRMAEKAAGISSSLHLHPFRAVCLLPAAKGVASRGSSGYQHRLHVWNLQSIHSDPFLWVQWSRMEHYRGLFCRYVRVCGGTASQRILGSKT